LNKFGHPSTFENILSVSAENIIFEIRGKGHVPWSDMEGPTLVADYLTDKNGRILPYVKFEGGSLRINLEAIQVLDKASEES